MQLKTILLQIIYSFYNTLICKGCLLSRNLDKTRDIKTPNEGEKRSIAKGKHKSRNPFLLWDLVLFAYSCLQKLS